jgi:Rrf2 family protein
MISMKAKYALKALVYLSLQPADRPTLVADIAEHENIPKKFLNAILLDLRNYGILQSRKGRGGGYLLRQAPDQIVLAGVLRMIDGPMAPVLCVSKTAYRRCDDCTDEQKCRIRRLMREVRDGIINVLENRTLADLVTRRPSEKSKNGLRRKSTEPRAVRALSR